MSDNAPISIPTGASNFTVEPGKTYTTEQPAPASSNALIASSGTSRSQTTSNINTLQTALNNVPPPTGSTGTDTTKSSSTSTPNNSSGGGSNPTQVTLPGGSSAYYSPANGTLPERMVDAATGKDLTYSQSIGGWIDPSTGAAPVTAPVTQPDSGNTSGGSTSTGNPNEDAVAGLPTNLQAIAKQNLDNIDQQYNQAQEAMTAAAATLANDPALAGAISSIQAKYKALYEAMAQKNQQVMGRASAEVGAFGGLGVMSQTFLSNEMDRAQGRLADVLSKEQAAIIAAQAAYQKGDVAALNAATTDLKAAQTAKSTAVSQLLTASNNAVKTVQAQQKIDQTATNSQINNDIKNAKGVAASLAEKLAAAGVTDLSSYDYTDISKQLGISSPEILAAAVQSAGDAATKADLGNANTADQIANRDAGTAIKQQNANKTSGGKVPAFKVSDGIAKVTPQMKAEVKASGSTDGYIDPAKWIAARDNWQTLGGTAASFKSNFIQYLNPASYVKAGYKAPAGAASTQYNTN